MAERIMICVRRHDEIPREELAAFEQKLEHYYAAPPACYFEIADQAAEQYQPQLMPFHCDLVKRIEPGMHLLELGCGSAHLCPQVEARGGNYTGMDYSAEQLQRNQERFPSARFFQLETSPEETFDIVASLYTIEHVTDPSGYLERMWHFCKPGGSLAVICPDFVDGDGFAPSIYFGRTPRRLREKLARLALADAARHLIDLYWSAPRWKACARSSAPGAFWINTRPAELEGRIHSIDTDAVHLPRVKDVAWWFERRGASIVATSETLPNVPAAVRRFNGYVFARKP